MNGNAHTALIACCHQKRKEQYTKSALEEGWDVHTVSHGADAFDLLHKRRYDLIVMDESIHDQSPVEFSLSAADIATNHPAIVVAARRFTPVKALWEKCRVIHAAPFEDIAAKLPHLLERVASSS